MVMKRFSAPATSVYPDPSRPPNDDDSEASLSDSGGSKKVKTAQSFESLFNSESLSDIIMDVNSGQCVFHAHKMIVGLKSERLAALITSVINSSENNNNKGANSLAGSSPPCKPVLYLQEDPACGAVFSRFLYFIYSGAVWLHRDYVVPLFQLSLKYGVGALATHCENYIHQLLNKCLTYYTSSETGTISNNNTNNNNNNNILPPSLPLATVCDLCEEEGYRDDTRKVAFSVLKRRFSDLIRTERWISCTWVTVRDLLYSDDCSCEENVILVSATDWMKRNKVQDKVQIQEILAAIRYPRLPRRVLYHLHATASFKNFPVVQDLIAAAIQYHCFKDVPEAQQDFSGLQYRARGGRFRARHTLCGGETLTRSCNSSTQQSSPDQDGENNNPHTNHHGPSQFPHECIHTETTISDAIMNGVCPSSSSTSPSSSSTSCSSTPGISCNEGTGFPCGYSQNPDVLPPCARSCCADSHHHHPHHHHHHHNHQTHMHHHHPHNHHPHHHRSSPRGTGQQHQHASRQQGDNIPSHATTQSNKSNTTTSCSIPESVTLVSSFRPVGSHHSPTVAAVQPRVQPRSQPPQPPVRDASIADRTGTPEFELEIEAGHTRV